MSGQTVVVSVLADTKRFTDGFKGAVSTSAKVGIGIAAGFGAAAVGLGKLTAKLISAGEESATSDARISQIAKSMGLFGAQADSVTQRLLGVADATARQTGIDDDAIKATQAKLLTFKALAATAGTVGGSFDRATKAAIDLAAAGFGSASSNATQLGKALADPTKGISALTRVGVTFTAAEKAKIAAMQASGDMAGAQALILKALETQVGGTAAATAKMSDRLKVGFSQIQQTIGVALLPAFNAIGAKLLTLMPQIEAIAGPLITTFSTWVTSLVSAAPALGSLTGGAAGALPVLSNLMALLNPATLVLKSLAPLLPQIGAMFAGIGTQLGTTLLPVLTQLGPTLAQVVNTLTASLGGIAATLLPIIAQLAAQMLPVLAQVIAAVVPVILQLATALLPIITLAGQLVSQLLPPLASAITAIIPAVMPLVQVIVGLVSALTPILAIIFQLIGTLIPPLVQVITALLPPIVQVVQVIASALVPIFAAVTQIITALMPLITALVGVIGAIITAILPVVAAIAGGLIRVLGALITIIVRVVAAIISFVANSVSAIAGWAKAVGDSVGKVAGWFGGIKDKVMGALSGAGTWLVSTGGALLTGLWTGISDKVTWLKGQIGGFTKSVETWFRDFFGIHSPSRMTFEFGTNLVTSLGLGILARAAAVTTAWATATKPITTLPSTPTVSLPTTLGTGVAQTIINLTVNGALDSNAVARQIIDILTRYLRMRGQLTVNGVLFA